MTDPTAHRSDQPRREELRRQRASGFRRSVGLTALGTLIPGAGLTQTRSRRLGWLLLGISIAAIAALTYLLMTNGVTHTVLSVVSRPQTLQVIIVTLVVLGLLWCASIILTAIQSRPAQLDRRSTRLLAGFAAVMVLIVAGLNFTVAQYVSITKTTVNDVFAASPAPDGKAPPIAKVVEGSDPWAATPRVNVLLIGSDAGPGRTGTRTDSMIVASIDTKTGKTVLIQLPRNLEQAPLSKDSPLRARYPSGKFGVPNSACDQGSHTCFLTNLWGEAGQWKQDHPASYPGDDNPGRTENRKSIELITGLRIDQEVIIDLEGFQQLVDAMGGITVNVKLSGFGTKLPIEGYSDGKGGTIGVQGYFNPGVQHLDGYHALWYARSRAADSDAYRQARQRCVVKAIVSQVNPASMLARYADIAKIARDNIYTDIPASSLPAFVDLIDRVQKSTIVSLPLSSVDVIVAANPDYDKIQALVAKAIAPPPPPAAAPAPTSSAPGTGTPSSSPNSTDAAEAAYDNC